MQEAYEYSEQQYSLLYCSTHQDVKKKYIVTGKCN